MPFISYQDASVSIYIQIEIKIAYQSPRHLLGKKSWNVYNADNIAKVKRDEAAAAAREEAEEQRMQEVDAERRIQILRGLRTDAPTHSPNDEQEKDARHGEHGPGRESKRRRIAGEDDTERDIRYAQEASAATPVKLDLQLKSPKSSDAPLTDSKGHINLFPMEGSRHNVPKNAEAEAESARKKKDFEDQYTMRFSNAAGFKQAVGQKPWYHSMGAEGEGEEPPLKDVWGNEDPRRKEREKMRIASDDPLAIIQQGVRDLREVERERNRWQEERDREMRELVQPRRQREKRTKRRHSDETLNNFSLDAPSKDEHHKQSRDRHSRHRHHLADRSHSPNRNKYPSHHHHHHLRSRSKARTSKKHSERHRLKREEPMAKLQQERDEREKAEHSRAATLLARSNADTRPGWEKGSGGRYSAQFAAT